MSTYETMVEERNGAVLVINYFKREISKLNNTNELDHIFDGLLSELHSYWNLQDSRREFDEETPTPTT